MCNLLKLFVAALLLISAAQAQPKIGRVATPAEVAAWDIDVRPDFKGLPRGQGTVAQGEIIWEGKCASCHGSFGELNTVFYPIAGGFKKTDIANGRVADFAGPSPERTTLSKLSSVSTLWDYINRAMPWNAPKTLTVDEVYAVTAYTLHLGNLVDANFTLNEKTIRDVQARLPNRNGKTTAHAMWPGVAAKPDVQGSACMRDCKVGTTVATQIPDYAMNAHGNLKDQMRPVGSQGGINTAPKAVAAAAAPSGNAAVLAALNKYACTACHADNSRLVGPSWQEVIGKHGKRADALAYLADKVKNGGTGVWGQIPMPAQSLSVAEAEQISKWILDGAKK
jgi:S-disulfanyl-L-cysteine oxidoreductase SoxD